MLIVVLLTSTIPSFGAEEAAIERFILRIGESALRDIPSATRVNISRRGIVDLTILQGGRVTMTALRSGFVVVSIFEDTEVIGKWFVQVTAQEKESDASLLRLCEKLKVKCDLSTKIVTGKLGSYRQKTALRSFCKSGRCQDGTSLSEKARQSLKAAVDQRLGKGHDVRVLDDGTVAVGVTCIGKRYRERTRTIQQLLNGILDKQALALPCSDEAESLFELEAWIIANEAGNDRSTGLQASFAGDPTEVAERLPTLVDDRGEGKKTILANPKMRLVRGGEAHFNSGGEFFVVEKQSRDEVSVWKRYGVNLVVKLLSSSNQLVRFTFDLDVKDRFGGASRTDISQGKLSGETLVDLSKKTFLGTIQVSADRNAKRGSFFLSSIPIVAPLGRVFSHEESASSIALYLRVRKVDLAAE